MEWIDSASPQRFDLSCNTALQSLEVRATGGFQECNRHTLQEALRTITSPVFSEIIVVFNEEDVHWPPPGMIDVLREMYEIKNFRLVFYLEASEESRVSNLQVLKETTQEAVGNGSFNFLPYPPLVISLAVSRDDLYIM